MRISVFRLGYVGALSVGCLANDGHEVLGVEPVATKIDLINRGVSPIVQKDVGEIIAAMAKVGRSRATSDPSQAIHVTELRSPSSAPPATPTAISILDISEGSANRSVKLSRTKRDARNTILPGTRSGGRQTSNSVVGASNNIMCLVGSAQVSLKRSL